MPNFNYGDYENMDQSRMKVICGIPVPERICNGLHVLTVKDIASIYAITEQAVRKNYDTRRQYFIDGIHYFLSAVKIN